MLETRSWQAVTLGEGMTPVVPLDGDTLLKMEQFAHAVVQGPRRRCAGRALPGHRRVSVADSSGNAGNAVGIKRRRGHPFRDSS